VNLFSIVKPSYTADEKAITSRFNHK